ncbi:HD domain-containing protein [Candidatus Berkelbacteria bacterium]|nr:HD domain-containing protein [Candidatus Berkelbacteria bacterium]
MNVPSWIEDLAKRFELVGFQFYLVGGSVRDYLIGREFNEWDATTNAKPDEIVPILKQFKASNINEVGRRFGTIAAEFLGESIEITTFRSEQYDFDSRKPVVNFGTNLRDDLSRRDFTINAIAYNPLSKELIDPFNGQRDIKEKIIRTVGNASDRFSEDPLRMLRAIRLLSVLEFELTEEVSEAIIEERSRFGILSAERVAQEMNKLLLSNKPSKAIKELVNTGLINFILPELLPSIDLEFDTSEHKDIYNHILQVLDKTPPKLALRWCALLHDIAKPQTRKKINGEYHFLGHEVVGARTATQVLNRLKYSNDFVKYVSKLVRYHQRIPNDDGNWTDGAVRRFVRDAGDTLEDLFLFADADNTGTNPKKLQLYKNRREKLFTRIEELDKQEQIAKIKSPLSGDELMSIFNRPAGIWIKPIKEHLLELVLDGKLDQNDKKTAEKIAREIQKPLGK